MKREHEYILGRRLRGPDEAPSFILGVAPNGRIKTLRFSTNGMSSKLRAEPMIVNGRKEGLRHVSLSTPARDEGWKQIEELYEDGREQDCDSVYQWYAAVSLRQSGKVSPLDPAYLPEQLEVIAGSYVQVKSIDIPPPQRPKRKRKAKAKHDPEPDSPGSVAEAT